MMGGRAGGQALLTHWVLPAPSFRSTATGRVHEEMGLGLTAEVWLLLFDDLTFKFELKP